jgi:signal transduction histidine kinase
MKPAVWMRSAWEALEQRLLSQRPAPAFAVSAALQSAGLLAVLLFLERNVFELFVSHGMYPAQHALIAAFDAIVSIWAIVEIVRLGPAAQVGGLGPLVAALVVQGIVGAVRAWFVLAAPAVEGPFERLSKPFEVGTAAFIGLVHAGVFLVIGKLIIDAFSSAERMRADELEAQVKLTKRAEADLRAKQREVEAAHRRERASAARQRRMLKLKLESSLKASAVAHEIKLPLSTILLRTRLAADTGAAVPETLEAVAGDAQKVVRTIEKMQMLLRSVQSEHAPVDLTGIVRTCLVESKWEFEKRRVVITTTGLERPCVIDGDDGQLRIAIMNGLRNAAEALGEHPPDAAAPTIAVALRRRRRFAVLAIGDNGPGWSGAERDAEPLSTTKPSGSGLGLYVVRTVVRNHRGKVAFRPSSLGGAELRLFFPQAAGRRAVAGEPAAGHEGDRIM